VTGSACGMGEERWVQNRTQSTSWLMKARLNSYEKGRKEVLTVYRFLIFLSILVLLSSCSTNGVTAIPLNTNTMHPSQTTIPPTLTSKPSATLTATIKPSFTPEPSPTRTMTLTPYPSPNPERAEELIKILLQKSMDCSSPCFGGIVPNKTTLSEARNILTNLGLELIAINNDNQHFVYNTDIRAKDKNLSLILTGHDEIISDINLGLLPEKQQPDVAREWLAFSPETLIHRYGQPSKLNLVLARGPSSDAMFMNVYFDIVNLIIQYGFDISHNKIRICPLIDQVIEIRLWVGNDPINPPKGGLPLEETTSLSLDTFSKLMTGEPKKACFSIKPEAFP
jgi:hypothetical protein